MIPVLTKEQAYKLDKDTIESGHLTQEELMDNAGKAVAQFFCEKIDNPFNQKVLIVCGKGNNGGDGVIAHSYLKIYNVSSKILFTEEKHGHSKLLKEYKIPKRDYSIYDDKTKFDKYDWIFDAIFGIGLSRELDDRYIDLIARINIKRNIISIDVPSGIYINAESIGIECIEAKYTLALGYPKIGFYFFGNREYVGNIYILDIGFKIIDSNLFLLDKNTINRIIKNFKNKKFITKYDKEVSIYSGSDKYPGATILASNGAFKSGAGYVNIRGEFTDKTSGIIQSNCPEAVLSNQLKYNALLIGPGLSKNFSLREYLFKSLPKKHPIDSEYNIKDNPTIVVDASALNPESINLSIKFKKFSFIRTPHLDELLRMLNFNTDSFIPLFDFIKGIRKNTKDNDITILKGPSTFIITKDMIYIMDRGPSILATAGSGDVLSGILVSLLSQGYSRLDASILGTYLHAEAANYYMNNISKDGMTASDLIDCIPHAFNILRNNEK